MKRTRLNKLFRVLTLVFLLPLVIAVLLITTESGLQFIYKFSVAYLPENLTIEKIEGSFIGPITLHNIQYKNNEILIKSEKLTLEWLPAALLSNSVQVRHLQIQSLSVNVLTAANKNTNNKTVNFSELNLPLRIVLNDVVIDKFSFSHAERTFNLKQIKLSLTTLSEQINIKSLTLATERSQVNLSGKINLNNNYQHKFALNWYIRLPESKTLSGEGHIQGDASKLIINQQVSGPLQLAFNAEIRDIFTRLNWQAEAKIIDINPATIWPEWPGHIKGTLSSHGHTDKDQLIANIDIAKLNGTLRGYPVSLQSHFSLRDTVLELSQFELHSGKTQLTADGRIDALLNIKWKLNSQHLAELYPNANGSLQAEGKITGPVSLPVFSTSILGKSLSLPGYKIANLRGNIGFDLFNWQQVNIVIDANTLTLKDHELKSVAINADNHTAQIKIISADTTSLIRLKGEVNSQGIHGHIEKADLNSQHIPDWKLVSPVRIDISHNKYSFSPFCWQSTRGKVCATLSENNHVWQSQININDFPIVAFSPWIHSDLKIKGVINAAANIQFHSTGMLSTSKLYADMKLTLPPGELSYPLIGAEYDQLSYLGGNLDLTINEQGLETSASIAINHEDNLKGQMSLAGVNILNLDQKTQPVQANVQLTMNNLALLEALIPEIQAVKGKAGLNFDVTGTLAQPRFTGEAQLTNGILQIPRLGLVIDQVNLICKSDGLEHLNFQITAHSGAGNIAIEGQTMLEQQAGWPTVMTIKGDNFEVAHIPVSQLRVSPDLKIKIQHHSIDISGEVHIPYAKLQPKDITTAEHVSDDTVIVGEEKPVEQKWLISTKVRLILGDRVNFYGFGFEGRFSGNLLLEDEPGQVTKANGEISVPEGRYFAYGQRLEVEHGRLLYSGGSITNPGLDIRAVRHIDTMTVGLKVRGTLKHPKIELFSLPPMGQTDILSYLLLGRPLESASGDEGKMMAKAALALSLIGGDSLARSIGDRFGLDVMRIDSSSTGEQASLVMGRYLSPKLYVGYGVGLIESFNTLIVRYQISDKWQLKGESGEAQGADLLYTIER